MKNKLIKGSKEWHDHWDPIIEKRKKTCLEKYGYFTSFQTKETQQKVKDTIQSKYGVNNVFKLPKIKEKIIATKIQKYGKDNISNQQKYKETCIQRYGVVNVSQLDSVKLKRIQTCQNNFGVDNPFQSELIKNKIKLTNLDKYGVFYASQNESVKEKCCSNNLLKYGYKYTSSVPKIRKLMETTLTQNGGIGAKRESTRLKMMNTSLLKYGVKHPTQCKRVKNKIMQTCLEKYNVLWYCLSKNCKLKGNNSKPNRDFESLLKNNNVTYEREFHLGNYSYDFKIKNYLIEINPWYTHNSSVVNHFNHVTSQYYHYDKSKLAYENGYMCLHIFDWIDINTILNGILNESIYLSDFRDVKCFIYNYRTKEIVNHSISLLDKNEVLIYDGGQDILYKENN